MTIDELRRAVHFLPGVTAAEVVARPGNPPIVRVWTDGTHTDDEVRRAVEALAAGVVPTTPTESGERTGLGRGLEETIPAAFAAPEPSHLTHDGAVAVEAPGVPEGRLRKLAIEETVAGVEVRAVSDDGREIGAVVGPGSDGLTNAVATAVALLRGFPPPSSVAVNTRDIDGSTVVTVLVQMPSGDRSAGAALVTGGLPFTVGRAVDSALSGLQ